MNKEELDQLQKGDLVKTWNKNKAGIALVVQTGFDDYIGTFEITGKRALKLIVDRSEEVLHPIGEVIEKITVNEAINFLKKE